MFETWEVLPYWLFITAIISASRTFQCYTPSLQQRIMRLLYSGAHFHETSALAARQFGTWHMLSTIVQINAGLFVHDRGAYNVALWSFILTLLHFLWERVAERTVGGRSLLAAEVLAFVSFCWMMVQREVYVGYGSRENMSSDTLYHPHHGEPYYPGPR
ncbi:hypothetical protein LTR65_008470 [Meristemomyces frigidus]